MLYIKDIDNLIFSDCVSSLMIKKKTYAFKNNIYCEIPKEVSEKLNLEAGDDLIFDISDVVKIKTVKGNSFLSAVEKVALANLNEIKHSERTQERVDADFDAKIVGSLMEKGILFSYQKNEKKMIGIDRKYVDFKLSSGILGELDVYGFLILDPIRIKELTYALESSKRSSQVIGVRGFDKKFYVILRSKFSKYKDEILSEIKKQKQLSEVSKALKINDAFCKTALEILKEEGEAIEKSKGIYQAV